MRAGGGVVNLPRADNPLVFAAPVALSFGLVAPTATQTQQVELTDAGGGAGVWAVSLAVQSAHPSVAVSLPPTVTVPGPLPVTVATMKAPDMEATGYVVLTRGAEKRRIPYWFRTGAAGLANAKTTPLRRAGTYSSTTKGGTVRITSYSYPESPSGFGFSSKLPGPERVFRLVLGRPATNFGVVVTSRADGVRVEPRIVHAGDERRLTGYAALPFNLNPYLRIFGEPVLAAGTILPAAGAYDVIFDSRSAATAGKFAFRFWLNDSTPPAVALKTKRVKRGTLAAGGGHGSWGRHRPGVAGRPGRRQRASRQPGGEHGSGADRVTRQGPAYAAFPGLRLPGDEEHGERRPDPAEHAHPADDLRRQLNDNPLPESARSHP